MRFPFVILGLLIFVPLAELAVIIKVGGNIGTLPTIGLLIGVGILGTVLIRQQGLGILRRTEAAMAKGEMPVASALDGIGLLMAGVLMMTPGFLTDILGLALLIPQVRRWAAQWLLARATVTGLGSVRTSRTQRRREPGAGTKGGRGPVIDGEFTRVDDK